ncbi:peptidoglycan-binding protein [Amycolatopsis regifaucium]|uniref:peptidoglycan-binding protein n=1 Tax=Amycolatopsis regifaucium TaxID=546365 RepID=UPI0008F63007|nr:peptidoglycan-binding protein [Amycolatopsis regifaucium]SFJ54719.1 Multidrug efflux pump subunit AcrA (membrane-fusion protein) [Amycolatopsis regifaucium]
MNRRTGLVLGAVVVAVVGVGAFVVVGSGDSGGTAGTVAMPPATAEITRADLIRSKTVDGHFDYANRRAVKSPVEGTVTQAAEPGKTVERGQVLYKRDARPVVLLYGATPMFRDMTVGTLGPDVQQLKRNLRDLGRGKGLPADNKYDEATQAAVKSWQKALGVLEPTGDLGKGDLVFQPGAVRVVAADAALADQIGADKPVLTIASPKPVVRAKLDREDQVLAKPGTRVEVSLPDGATAGGQVTGTVKAEAGNGAEATPGTTGVEVEITLDDANAGSGDTTGTSSVKFIQESRKGVLTVPVEAIVALREGGYGLQIVRDTATTTVRVETGMSADGRIEITGDGLAEGMKVGAAKP